MSRLIRGCAAVVLLGAMPLVVTGCVGSKPRVARLSDMRGHLVVKPTKIPANGKDMPAITDIKWSRWGKDPAVGRGKLVVDACMAVCGRGQWVRVPVRVRAIELINCDSDGPKYGSVTFDPVRNLVKYGINPGQARGMNWDGDSPFLVPAAGCPESGPSG